MPNEWLLVPESIGQNADGKGPARDEVARSELGPFNRLITIP